MISELKPINHLYYLDELYIKYFNDGLNSDSKTFTELEKQKIVELWDKINNFTQKVFNEKEKKIDIHFLFGYLTDYGYYIKTDADRGYYDIINIGQTANEAFFYIIDRLLTIIAMDYELINREELEQKYHSRFTNSDYTQCLSYAEYCLNKWNIYYDNNMPQELVDYYEEYLNSTNYNEPNITWKYNPNTQSFIQQPIIMNQKIKC